jgi:hypothetical protein
MQAVSATFLLPALFESVVQIPHRRITSVSDSRSYTSVEYRSNVGVPLFADCFLARHVAAFLSLGIETGVGD